MDIKPIETIYNGYRFRSRLEARWAVFFDTLGIHQYDYEKEGYILPDGTKYLPDFWIQRWDTWVEIKPEYPTDAEINKCRWLSTATQKTCIIIWGSPYASRVSVDDPYHEYYDYKYRFAMTHPSRRQLKSGNIANEDDFDAGESHIFTQCRRCPAINFLTISSSPDMTWPDDGKIIKPIATTAVTGCGSVEPCCDTDAWPVMDLDLLPQFQAAYTAARQARFEYGERG